MKNETAQNAVRPATVGQVKDIAALLTSAIPGDLTFETATDMISRKGEIVDRIKKLFPVSADLKNPLKDWEHFYQKVFGITVDLSGVKIPERREGFNRLIVVIEGITLNQVYDACSEHFKCWKYADNLDKVIPMNDRDPKKIGTYAIWIRGGEEADEELKNLSADDLTKKQTKTVTALEQKLFELKYFVETGRHLDQKTVTLCAGSRDSGGDVPGSYWNDDKSFVNLYFTSYRNGNLRGREVVS